MPAGLLVGNRRVLLENPKIRSWHAARALKSRLSADVDLRKIRLLLARLRMDPESVVRIASTNPDQLQDALIRYAADLKSAGRVDDYIAKTLSGLKSYLRFRRVAFDGFPSLNPIRGSTLVNERVPNPEELGGVLERLSLRGRVIALLMAHAGVRPQVIGDYTGERGLTLGDLPELDLGRLEFSEIPFVVRVPAELSKTRASYVSFGTQQLATTLKTYLAARRNLGEKLSKTSPVVASTDTRNLRGATRKARRAVQARRRFMVTGALVREIRDALQAAVPSGVSWRPYVCRSYCSTRLLLAEGSGKISRDLREEILGHSTGVAGRYHVGKRWGEELLAEARREYANASEFLETNAQTRINVAAEFRRTLLGVAGLSEEEAAQHMTDSNDDLLALLRNKLTDRDAATSKPSNGHGAQKPVPLADAERLLAEGWIFVANFGPDRVILQPPS
jgi:hypothetical protein